MKFFHWNPYHKGGVTIAYELHTTKQGHYIQMAVAQCSKKDVYCKQTGRDVAIDRFVNNQTFILTVKGSTKAIKRRISNTLAAFANSIWNLQENQNAD